MKGILETVVPVCVLLIAMEAVGKFCPKSAVLHFVHALAVTALFSSAVLSFFSADLGLELPRRKEALAGEALSGYLEEAYEDAAEGEIRRFLDGLFDSAGIKAEEIQIFTDIGEGPSIELTKVRAAFRYPSEGERGYRLLSEVLGDNVEVEVTGLWS